MVPGKEQATACTHVLTAGHCLAESLGSVTTSATITGRFLILLSHARDMSRELLLATRLYTALEYCSCVRHVPRFLDETANQ